MRCLTCGEEVTPVVLAQGMLYENCQCPRCGHIQQQETALYAGSRLAMEIMKALDWSDMKAIPTSRHG